jgi:MFS family permease
MAGPARGSRLDASYWRLWASASSSNLGDGVRLTAFTLLAAAVTRDPALVAGVTVAATLPWLLLGLPAGAVVDSRDRRALLVRANLARGLAVGLLGLAVLAGVESLVAIYLVVFLIGAAETLVDNAALSIVPTLVDRKDLERANGYLVTAKTVTNEFAGVTLGGVLFGLAAWAPLFVEAAAMTVAAGLAFGLRGAFRPTVAGGDEAPTILAQIRDGLSWLARDSALRTLTWLVAIIGLVDTAWFAILVLFALEILELDAAGYGILLAVGAAGSVAGGISAAMISQRVGSGTALLGAVVAMAVTQLAIGLTSSAIVAATMMAGGGFAFAVWGVVAASLRQRLAPDYLLGRVNAAYKFAGVGAQPVGALAGGFAAQVWGLRAPFLLGAPILLLAAGLAASTFTSSASRNTGRGHEHGA